MTRLYQIQYLGVELYVAAYDIFCAMDFCERVKNIRLNGAKFHIQEVELPTLWLFNSSVTVEDTESYQAYTALYEMEYIYDRDESDHIICTNDVLAAKNFLLSNENVDIASDDAVRITAIGRRYDKIHISSPDFLMEVEKSLD